MTLISPKILLNNHDEFKFRDESFEMDGNFEVRTDIGRVYCQGQMLLSEGNMMTVVMRPGAGKSTLCEALCSGGINTDADSFGFEVKIGDRDMLFIDTERTTNDLAKGYKTIIRRARAYNEPGIMQNNKLVRLRVHSYRVLDSPEKYIKHLEAHLKNGNFSLVLLDQAADFLKSINNETEAIEFVKKLEYLTAFYKIAILVTIHPNPMDKTFKPTGWLGTLLLKKSETVMLGRKIDSVTTLVTTNFDHGKVRNASSEVETAFMYDKEMKMHVSANVTENIKDVFKKYDFLDKPIHEVFDKVPNWLPEDLVVAIREKVSKKHKETVTEEFLISYSADMGIINKFGLHYSLTKASAGDEAPF